MRTWIINQTSKARIESLDEAIPFEAGIVLAVPIWGTKKFIVREVIYIASTSGELASFTQNVYVSEQDEKET